MKAKVLNIHKNKAIFLAMLAVSALSIIVYIYAVTRTVHNIVDRQSIERELSLLSTNISEFEFQYIAIKNGVTIDLAKSLGFQLSSHTVFVSRATVAFAGDATRSR
jgi:hypothetical protein